MNVWMEQATLQAQQAYGEFFDHVMPRALTERDPRERPLGDKLKAGIAKGTHIDTRVIRLMAISGKGGWHKDPARRERYARNANVTLLDHLLSVARGAMLLYALDCLERTPDMDKIRLRKHLCAIAVLAFLHDLDKMLELDRGSELALEDVAEALQRYGIPAFLEHAGIEPLAADQIRYLIEKVEGSETNRHLPESLPPQYWERLAGYVGLADKLDGAWLSSDPDKGGLPRVLRRLREDRTLQGDLLRHWRALDLFDPHHPFLLDELQRCLSLTSLRSAGVPPLIEVHQDGRLFMLLPAQDYDMLVARAIERLCRNLPFELELTVSVRGLPALANGSPTYEGLLAFLDELPARDFGRLFLVKAALQEKLTARLDEMLGELGLAPQWPKQSGALTTPYPDPSGLEPSARTRLINAACLALLLNLNLEAPKEIPDASERERRLLASTQEARPDCLESIEDGASRRVLTALWIMVCAESDPEFRNRIFGDEGLLENWLEGTDEQPGLNKFISGRGQRVAESVATRLRQLLMGQRVVSPDEQETGRCLFTDEPMPFEDTIDQSLGLHEVRISAFSGRDYRPESLTSEAAHTNVSPVSVAEHKLRAKAHELQGGKPDGVPALISSPSTLGLFGGLALSSDQAMRGMSIYDLSRQDAKKGIVYSGLEHYRGRYRIARFERLAEKTEGQVNQLRLLLQACRRAGRPIHIYRGLPTQERAFFHYDAMPRLLAELIGGNSLRLEQIPAALKHLETAQTLLETNGLGYDVLRLYATPGTRFQAICLAWCHLRDAGKNPGDFLNDYFIHREKLMMSTQDAALVRFGESAAKIQRRPGYQASGNEEMLVLNLCLDFTLGARALGQADEASLINGIASELEVNLVRKHKAAACQHRDDEPLRAGCLEVAGEFVREVWFGVLKERPPTQRARRILGSIYRIAFLQAAQTNKDSSDQSE
jgi:hypothetical protein